MVGLMKELGYRQNKSKSSINAWWKAHSLNMIIHHLETVASKKVNLPNFPPWLKKFLKNSNNNNDGIIIIVIND